MMGALHFYTFLISRLHLDFFSLDATSAKAFLCRQAPCISALLVYIELLNFFSQEWTMSIYFDIYLNIYCGSKHHQVGI